MSYFVMTISRGLFFRLLAYAPEALQGEAREEARRAIPPLCFTEDDIRQKFAVEERWNWLSEAEHREAIQSLLDAGEYEHAGTVANDAIAEAVARYLDDAFLEKIKQQAVGGFTW
jgi:DNA-binding LacI/PurR family transcriptional regulator